MTTETAEQPEQQQPEEAAAEETATQAAEAGGEAVDLQAARIAELEAKLAEATDRMLRAVAEADNTRKRLEKERQDTAKFAVTSFARDILSVADNLRRALSAITPEMKEKSPELKNIALGVEMTEKELLNVFEKNGIRKVDPLNQKFDPNLHEVMFETDVTDKPPGFVVQVVEAGYTIHERLLRPARVGVSKGGGENAPKVDQEV